jgi:hypothetical protein
MGKAKGIDDNQPTAYVDESMREGPDGLYVIAAVTIIDDVARARAAAEKAPPAGQRFHWKNERDPSRMAMLDVLLELDCGLHSYEAQPCPVSKQERARAKCLEALLWDLQQLGVRQLVIESRGAAADRKDRSTILRAIKAGKADPDLVYEHRKPFDAALWLPDAVAGAAATALTGQTKYRDRLGSALERTKVAL